MLSSPFSFNFYLSFSGPCPNLLKPLLSVLIFLLPHQVLLPRGLKGRIAILLLLLRLCSTDLITYTHTHTHSDERLSQVHSKQLRFFTNLLDNLSYCLTSALDASVMMKVRSEWSFYRHHLWTILHSKIPGTFF